MKDAVLKLAVARALLDIVGEVCSETCVDRYEESLAEQGLPSLYDSKDALRKAVEEAGQ